MDISPKQLLEQLVKNSVIDQEVSNRLELASLQKNIPIYDYLLGEGSIKKLEVLKAASELYNIPYVDLASLPIEPQAVSFVSESIAEKYTIIPYKFDMRNKIVYMASADPFNTNVLDFLERKIGCKVILSLAAADDVKKFISIAYAQGLSPEVNEALKQYQTTELKSAVKDAGSIIKEAPIAKIVTTILEFAFKGRASDIHIEPEELKTRVRYRIDGVLAEKLTLPKSIHEGLVSRIKILSELKIDEKRIPQDGRFTFKLGEDEIDLRVSTLPTIFGEKVVMRLLKKTGGIPELSELGLRGPQYRDVEEALTKPYGVVLVTGPTGSGKTTTLYSILSRLNKPSINIVTLEDPVEYQILGINQVQINPQAGLTFANGLRSFLRQDPNIILVGEIRDTETTQLAIQAALTGHLVFSTLHTNDSATAIPRLIDLGGEPFLIASVLIASVAQRIVRRICTHCKEWYEAPAPVEENIRKVLGALLPPDMKDKKIKLARGKGCQECADTGYMGRVAIFEVLRISPAIGKMILQHLPASQIEDQAKSEGLISMIQDGYLRALEGVSTIEETLRVSEN